MTLVDRGGVRHAVARGQRSWRAPSQTHARALPMNTARRAISVRLTGGTVPAQHTLTHSMGSHGAPPHDPTFGVSDLPMESALSECGDEDSIPDAGSLARFWWLTFGVVVCWILLLMPALLARPRVVPLPWAIAQLAACGVILGFNTQGFDTLALRASVASLAAFVVGSTCSGVGDCVLAAGLVVSFGAPIAGVLLCLVAVPVNVLRHRAVRQLAPELPWRNLRRPRGLRQLAFTGLVVGVALAVLGLVAIVPKP